VFAHVPMILGPDGRRLSKRHGATAVGEYHNQGILPQALFNFLALLGWSSGTDEEILDSDELVRRFSLDGINRKSAIFDTQKLEWMNGRYLAAVPSREAASMLRAAYEDAPQYPDAWWHDLADLLKVRARTTLDMCEQARPYVYDELTYDPAAVAKHWKDPAALGPRLKRLRDDLEGLEVWTEPEIEQVIRHRADAEGISAGRTIHPLRVALTGTAASPGIFELSRLLGKARVLERIDRALRVLAAGP
jgi:glutamyl-tRNA synthetase